MYFRIPKKVVAVTSIVLFLFSCSASLAEPVSVEQALKVADTFLRARQARQSKDISLLSIKAPVGELTPAGLKEILADDGTVLAYITEIEPRGFVATSAQTDITPIVAYSFSSPFPSEDDEKNPLYRLLKEDMRLRALALAESKLSGATENSSLWSMYANEGTGPYASDTFRQWPQENTTSTGGWLETAWNQSEPYKDFCPLDPVDGERSVVGCVATAMAQIINYHQLCNATFDESDRYSTYSGIDIDADSTRYDFPSLKELNEYLSAIRVKYSQGADLNDVDAAALSFACGVSVNMDYSSEGSGAYLWDLEESMSEKFGFYSAEMTGGLSNEFFALLQQNIINQFPALIGITYPTLGGGHVIVCDGYNTNGEYHLNFGWGSPYPEEITEAWYRLPVEIPTSFNAVDEMVLNIRPVPPGIEIDPGYVLFRSTPGVESEPVPVFIKNNTEGPLTVNSVWSPEGFAISLSDGDYSDHIESFTIQRPGQEAAINVKFLSEAAGGYYGMLTVNYGYDKTMYAILTGSAVGGGTDVEAGEVSGTWSKAQSPYYVLGDISIPKDGELIIEPGVRVVFMGPYGLTIGENTRLWAEGTVSDPIEFTASSKELGWKGLRFLKSGDDDILSHCSITFSKKGSESTAKNVGDTRGGAIYCNSSYMTIMHCKITNNIGDSGGAIYCFDSDLVISNTVIANNTSMGDYPQSGGICCLGDSVLQIDNCTIVNNFPGGVLSQASYLTEVTNTILWGNGNYQMDSYESISEVTFCDVQDGYPGNGNINADPCFFDPSSGIGADYDGSVANWTLKSSSPCINGGIDIGLPEIDLAGNARIYSELVDIGAYENQSELPLMTLLPASIIDVGSTGIGDVTAETLEIVNTGKIDFKIDSLSLDDANSPFSIITPINDYVLASFDSVSVEIGFTPVEEKIYSDTLHIQSTSSNGARRTLSLHGVGVSGTIIPAGEVRGTWTKADSPYAVAGDIEVQRGRKLTIEPGVVVKFTGHYSLRVGARATLEAVGTELEPIVFTSVDVNEGWYGIRFVDAGDDDVLKYCTIEHAKKAYIGQPNWEDGIGGGILCGMSYTATSVPSSPTIDHCLIANNYSLYGGGIMCMDESEAVITNNRIVENSSLVGGGIWVYFANPTIANNIIAHNSAQAYGGGIYNFFGIPSITNNTIAHNRPNGLDLDIVALWNIEKGASVLNNVVWENEIYVWDYVMPEEYDIRFNNIQGGWEEKEGEEGQEDNGNIDVDPLFADSKNRDYHLKSQAGRWDPASQSWVVDDVTSPCIDAGALESPVGEEPAPHGDRINMGVFGGTSQASKSSSL